MADLDYDFLQRELDRTKSQVFLGKNAAFLGSLMCSMDFFWNEDEPTASTNGIDYSWNPHWFLSLPPKTRCTVLIHELWHPARLHMLRRGDRDPQYWNYACDIRINNDLENEGYSFEGVEWAWKDHSFDANGRAAEEDIYDQLMQTMPPIPPQPGGGDLREPSKEQLHKQVNAVVKAVHQAKLAGQAGSIPGNIEELIKQFLEPILPWEQLLMQFFTDLLDEDYSWKRPNRRYQDLYLPCRFTDDGRLEHLIYYLDVSGSISDKDVLRFNSEVKYIKESLNPAKLTLVQFDTTIRQERVFHEHDLFEEVVVVGRGGTSLVPVREHIHQHKPTAAIIFSDLDCPAMQPLDYDIPVIWIAVHARGRDVPFGKLIHIKG